MWNSVRLKAKPLQPRPRTVNEMMEAGTEVVCLMNSDLSRRWPAETAAEEFKTLLPLQSVELSILTLYITNSAAPPQSGRGQAFASCGVAPPTPKKKKKHYKISLEISAYIGGIFTVNQFLYDTEIISGSGRASAELRGKSCRCRFYLPALMPGINGLIHQTFNCLGRDLGCRYQLSKCRRGA